MERDLFALPARLGGLSIDNPVVDSALKFADSQKLTGELADLVRSSARKYDIDLDGLRELKTAIKTSRLARVEMKAMAIRRSASSHAESHGCCSREGSIDHFHGQAS